jgi:hypothetical protein
MAKDCLFPRGFLTRDFELSPEFEGWPAIFAPECCCTIALAGKSSFPIVSFSR